MKDSIIEQGLNEKNLYRESLITDFEAGALKVFMPVTPEGEIDETRENKYMALTNVMTPQGPLPITAEMGEEVTTLSQAIVGFKEAIDNRVEEMVAEAERHAREEATKIIVPGEANGPQLTMV